MLESTPRETLLDSGGWGEFFAYVFTTPAVYNPTTKDLGYLALQADPLHVQKMNPSILPDIRDGRVVFEDYWAEIHVRAESIRNAVRRRLNDVRDLDPVEYGRLLAYAGSDGYGFADHGMFDLIPRSDLERYVQLPPDTHLRQFAQIVAKAWLAQHPE